MAIERQLGFVNKSLFFYDAQSYSNPQEFDPARVQPTVPDYSHPPPDWPFSPYPNLPNPNYPGYYSEYPIYSTPSIFNSNLYPLYQSQTKGYSKSIVMIREGAGVCYLTDRAQIIENNNPYYNEDGEIINPIYGVVQQCQFRVGQLINLIQEIYTNWIGVTTSISPFPFYFNPNSDPETWIVTFNVPKNSCFVGQSLDLLQWGQFMGRVIVKEITSFDENLDQITARSLSYYINEGSPQINRYSVVAVNPIILKAQITDIQYNTNVTSEGVGEISVFFETYQVENGNEQYPALSNWLVEWQHHTGNYDSNLGILTLPFPIDGQNYNQNESYAAKQSYNELYFTPYEKPNGTGHCSFDFNYAGSQSFITSDTDFLKSGYTQSWVNGRWFIYDDDEANRPWNGVTVSVNYKIERTRTTTNYYYPNLILMPPFYFIEDSYSETNVEKDTDYGSVSKTFSDSDFSLTNPNCNYTGPRENGVPSGPGQGYCYGDEPIGEPTISNNLFDWRSSEYESIYQEITFQSYIPPSPPYPGYYIPTKRIVIISDMTMSAGVSKDRDEKYGDLPGVEFGMVAPQSFFP